jgi:hypothetical protein
MDSLTISARFSTRFRSAPSVPSTNGERHPCRGPELQMCQVGIRVRRQALKSCLWSVVGMLVFGKRLHPIKCKIRW